MSQQKKENSFEKKTLKKLNQTKASEGTDRQSEDKREIYLKGEKKKKKQTGKE